MQYIVTLHSSASEAIDLYEEELVNLSCAFKWFLVTDKENTEAVKWVFIGLLVYISVLNPYPLKKNGRRFFKGSLVKEIALFRTMICTYNHSYTSYPI